MDNQSILKELSLKSAAGQLFVVGGDIGESEQYPNDFLRIGRKYTGEGKTCEQALADLLVKEFYGTFNFMRACTGLFNQSSIVTPSNLINESMIEKVVSLIERNRIMVRSLFIPCSDSLGMSPCDHHVLS